MEDLWRRTSWPQDALNFNARFPGCSVNGTWVLEACIDYVSYGKVFLISRENFPVSLPETPPYPLQKSSVWDISIGSEYIEILSTLCCFTLLLNCSLIFFHYYHSIKHLLHQHVYCSILYVYYTFAWENDLNRFKEFLTYSCSFFHYMYYDVCTILGLL